VDRLVVGAFSPSVVLRVARRLDLLGLDVVEQPVPSSPAQFADLLDGRLDAALTSPDNVIAYRFVEGNPLGRTGDVRIAAAVDRGLGLAVYGRPGLASAADLKGQVIGVDVPHSGFAFGLYAVLASLGLEPGDYRLAALGSTPRRLDALLAGDCAATMLNAGADLRAEQAGAVRLARLADVSGPYLGTVLCAVGGHRAAAVLSLAGALREATGAILRGEADAVALEEAAGALRLPPEVAARYVERLKDPREGLVASGLADLESLTTVAGLRHRYGPSPLDVAAVLAPAAGLVDTRTAGDPARGSEGQPSADLARGSEGGPGR
jgi:ABC-type nitrate/sulfonate/bicarbonate transport system substrate-binding protein